MLFLDIDEQWPRTGIFTGCDRLIGGRDARDGNTAHRVEIFLEEAVAEDTDRIGVGFQLLDNQIVIFAGIQIRPVGADLVTDRFKLFLVAVLQRLGRGVGLAAEFHDQLGQRVARARCRWRAIDADRLGWQRGIDVRPFLVTIFLAERFRGDRLVNLLGGQSEARAFLGLGDSDTVDADNDFGDVGDAIGLAQFKFRRLHSPRGIFDIGRVGADSRTEQAHACAGTGRFQNRCLEAAGSNKIFRNRLGEGKYGGGANDADLVAGSAAAAGLIFTASQSDRRQCDYCQFAFHQNFLAEDCFHTENSCAIVRSRPLPLIHDRRIT